MSGVDPNHETHLAVLTSLVRVSADPRQLVAVLAEAEDDDEALRSLREAYDFTPVQARAVLDCPMRRISRAGRAQMDTELRDLRHALAVPWDPPLEVQATMNSPEIAELVIAGVQHRIRGENLDDCLFRVVSLVWEELAWPQRRRVAVTTGLPGGPERILIDPVGSATSSTTAMPRTLGPIRGRPRPLLSITRRSRVSTLGRSSRPQSVRRELLTQDWLLSALPACEVR